MHIKDMIKSKRLEKGMTMKMLSEAIGVSEGTISRFEAGDTANMRLSNAIALSEVLGIPSSVFFGQKTSNNNMATEDVRHSSPAKKISECNKTSAIDRAADVLFSNDIVHTSSTVMAHVSSKCKMTPTIDEQEDVMLRRRLHSAIHLKQYSLQEAAEATGLAEATIEGWLNGTLDYYWPNQRRISTGLNIPFKYLCGDYQFPFEHEERLYLQHLANKNTEAAKIPYIGTASIDIPYIAPNYKLRISPSSDIPTDFCITQGDNSLLGSYIRKGDLLFCVYVDGAKDIQNGTLVVCRHNEYLKTMRFYHDSDLHIIQLSADSSEIQPLLYHDNNEDIPEILGTVAYYQHPNP